MDGSYGNVFPTGKASPASTPASNNGNQYKINVNRQKTRKWANFKPQNYDGDDWGAEDDEPEPEPEDETEPAPAPPPKPFGPRHPAAHSPTARQFQPTGSPALPALPSQYPAAAPVRPGQRQASSGAQRSATETLASSTSPQEAAGHGRPVYSPDGRRASPAPQGAHPLPSQLPLTDTPKSWVEPRSMSPRDGSPLASPNKPLPFIRPADVYRRMEEEREKERRSLENARPEADSTAGKLGKPVVLQTQRQAEAPTQSTDTTALEGADGRATSRVLNTVAEGLAPIAERPESSPEGQSIGHGAGGVHAEPAAQEQVKFTESQKSVQPVSHQDLRRYSRSPQLPDLSRMSGFGDDLFSSSLFPSPGLRSPVSDSMQFATSGQSTPASAPSAAAVAGDAPGQSAVTAVHDNVVSTTASGTDPHSAMAEAPQRVPGAGVNDDEMRSQPSERDQDKAGAGQPVPEFREEQTPVAEVLREREAAARSEEQPAAAATGTPLPGGWVSETPPTPAEAAAGSSCKSPRQPTENSAAAYTANPSRLDADASSETGPTRDSEEAGIARAAGVTEGHSPVQPHPASPHSLSPLRISSPALSTKPESMDRPQATAEERGNDTPSSPGAATTEHGAPVPTKTTTEHSEITPTAPLNPRRSTPEVASTPHPPVPSQVSGSEPSLEVSSSSPVKDSDMLSEEIIKSLSPVLPSGTEGLTATYGAVAAAPTRESSYLGDVYGDYWATTEDKAEPGILAAGKASDETEKVRRDPSPGAAGSRSEVSAAAAATHGPNGSSTPSTAEPRKAPESAAESTAEAGGLRRRFSWEAALEGSVPAGLTPTTTEPLVEQKALGSGIDNVAPSAAKPAAPDSESVRRSSDSEGEQQSNDARAAEAPEPLPATSSADVPEDLPSPVSARTDGPGGGPRRLSLAEEKIVLQESANPVSPSPPLDQHPVFFAGAPQQSRQADPQGAPSPKNIVGFRNIMELPLPSERIKHYNETRWQFSTMDTGLDHWLKAMMNRHPEHGDIMQSYSGAALSAQQSGQGAATQAPGQGGRAPTHLHMGNFQHGLSGLGHSSNQVGTKSKELLMAAGKAGKGLLSKGRNKLRGTGDKVFSSS